MAQASATIDQEPKWLNKSQVEEQLSEEELEQIQKGTNKVVQKVRICSSHENVYRMVILAILVILIVAATLATIHLHRIADYKVGFTSTGPSVNILQLIT